MDNELARFGVLMSQRNNVNAAQVVCITMFVITLQLTYAAAVRGKLSAANRLSPFYCNLVWTEWADLVAHVLILTLVGTHGNAAMIYCWFEVAHIVTSLAQIKLRVSMTRFMLMTTRLYSPAVLVLCMASVYVVRVLLVVAAIAAYYAAGSTVMSWLSVTIGEFLSLTYDLVIFEYSHMVSITTTSRSAAAQQTDMANSSGSGSLARAGPQPGQPVTLRAFMVNFLRPQHLWITLLAATGAIVSGVGFYAESDRLGVLQSMGYALYLATFYAYRELLLDNVENWLLRSDNAASGRQQGPARATNATALAAAGPSPLRGTQTLGVRSIADLAQPLPAVPAKAV